MNEALAYAARAGVGIVAMKTTAGAFRDKSRTSPLNTDAALKWVLQNEHVTSIVSGMSSVDELRKNIAMISNLKITDQELKDLNLANLNSESSMYCHQCDNCISQCPHNVDIPTLMRSYMYAYGYRNLEHAWYTLNQVDLSGRPCDTCDACRVKCIAGFDIKGRIRDIARLSDVPKEFILA
jgi:predicted aldo/keto reductase-like oxidoreductase